MGAENTRLNDKVYIDYMYIDRAVCYIWLMTQRISAQLNLLSHLQPNLSGRPYLHYAEPVYTGLLNTLVFDDDSHFRYTFVEICEIHDIEWQKSGTQHHSALCRGERYHEPIRCMFRKLRIDNPKLKNEFLLS